MLLPSVCPSVELVVLVPPNSAEGHVELKKDKGKRSGLMLW